jgi:enoyl-CoA hydratase/carnithine racemase
MTQGSGGAPARLEVDDGVGVIRLDRPPANAIDLAMGLALQDVIAQAAAREDVGAVVVWGGPKIFAAGADIAAMATWGPDEARPSVEALGAACDMLE